MDNVSGFCSLTVTFHWQTSMRFLFCSSLRLWGTHLVHTWLRPNSTVRIWWNLSNDTLKLPDISINDNVLSACSSCSALSVHTSVMPLLGLPIQASSTALLFLSRKCLHCPNTSLAIASVPYPFCNICNVSCPFFLSFTQNSVANLCLKIYGIQRGGW
jgi:hypothetical protein